MSCFDFEKLFSSTSVAYDFELKAMFLLRMHGSGMYIIIAIKSSYMVIWERLKLTTPHQPSVASAASPDQHTRAGYTSPQEGNTRSSR